jgi:hypothetical protein
MKDTCDSCCEHEQDSEQELFEYTCPVCKETLNLCGICSSVVIKTHKCIDCLNDG